MNELHDKIARGLADRGMLVQAGFAAFAGTPILEGKTEAQRHELLVVYMSGAQHVWGSIMGMLDAGDEITEADMRRMDSIRKELDRWAKILAARFIETKGTA